MLALEAALSAAVYIAQALFLGYLAAASWLLPRGEPVVIRRHLLARALMCLLIFLLAAVGTLLLQGAKLQRGAFPSWEILLRYLSATQSGNVWMLREFLGAMLALILLWLRRRDDALGIFRAFAIFAAVLIGSRSLLSHAVAVKPAPTPAVLADAVHLIGTALWAGGLVAVLTALRKARAASLSDPSWTTQLICLFSRVAAVCVVLLAGAGFYLSWVHVGSFTTLIRTDSGRVLITKLALFAVMVAFGTLNAFSMKPTLQRNPTNDAVLNTTIKRIRWESALGLMIFAVTGYLTMLPPGVHALHAAAQQLPPQAKTPALRPAEGASVNILAPKNDQIFTGDQVPLKFKLTKGKEGHHAHAYVDGELMGMFEGNSGTLNGITPGKHVLELRVVADDHQTELDARDQVTFTVR